MLYILRDAERVENCLDYIRQQPVGDKVAVEIRPYRSTRSQAQNRLMWMWYREIGEYCGYSPQEVHERMKARVLGVESVTLPRWFMGDDVGRLELVRPKSTAGLSVQEMTEFLVAIEALARHLGIALPYPDDYRFAVDGEAVFNKNKEEKNEASKTKIA